VDYSDSTPDVTYGYDRRGRQNSVAANGITTTLTYNDASQLLGEAYSGGILNGLAVTNGYDRFLRRTNLALKTQPSTATQFGYDNAGRVQSVTNGNYTATYTYLANSPLVSQISFKSNSVTRMTTTKSYDFLNRLSSISSAPSASSAVSFSYAYNQANQRTRATLADGSYWLYDYDSLGQVRSGKKYWGDGTPARPVRYYAPIPLRLCAAQLERQRVLRWSDRRLATTVWPARLRAGDVHRSSPSSGVDLL
jgi:YD repeat-containing protein